MKQKNKDMAYTAYLGWVARQAMLRHMRKWNYEKRKTISMSVQAVRIQKDYVCYLAQEWAGARK